MNVTDLFGTEHKPRGAPSAHESHSGGSDEWLTPPWILQALGPFDLDPRQEDMQDAPIPCPTTNGTTAPTVNRSAVPVRTRPRRNGGLSMGDKNKGLVFYPASHRYRLDGRWVQGVTTLIKGGLPNKALMYWSARTVAEYVADQPDQVKNLRAMGRAPMVAALKETPWQSRDEAAERGTEVHAFAERLAKGEEVDVPESLVGHVESCLAFLDDYEVRPLLIERPVASRKHQYAGTLDLVADTKYTPRAIFDHKTTRSGIWPETAFQCAAYAYAEFYTTEDMGGGRQEVDISPLGIEAAYGVHIRADGYDVIPLEFGSHVFDEFLAIAEVARIAKRSKGDRNTPGYVKPALQIEDE